MLSLLKRFLKRLFAVTGYAIVRHEYNCLSTSHLDYVLKQTLPELTPAPANPRFPTIFDVGANIGQMTHRLRGVAPTARLYSFEPVSATYEQLVANVEGLDGISCHKIALGERDGSDRIYLRDESQWNSLVPAINAVLREENRQFVPVEVQTLDSFTIANSIDQIDLLKIDTEGYELEVLNGARRLFEEGRIGAVLLEVGFDPEQLQHSYYLDIFRRLDQFGFRFRGLFDLSYDAQGRLDFANALFQRRP